MTLAVLHQISPGRLKEIHAMKKQILLLFGLILIGVLGTAAGIEASKGNWDYHSLLSSQELMVSN